MDTDEDRPAILLTLVKVFLAQFGSFESSGPGADPRKLVGAVLALLAAPGYYISLQAVMLGPWLMAERQHLPPFAWLWREEWVIFVLSFSAVAVLAAVESRNFVLDDRDYRVLGPLPARRSTVLVAKALSIWAAVVVVHLAINALAGLILPIAVPVPYARGVMALQIALFAQTVFVVAAIVSSQAIANGLLPGSVAARTATLLRGMVFLGVGILLLSQGWLSALVLSVWDQRHPVNGLVPVVWFLGLYRYLLGAEAAQFARQAQLALAVSVGAVVVMIPCCLLGYRDAEGRRRGRTRAPWPSRLAETVCALTSSSAVSRGVAHFVVRAIVRSPGAPFVLQGWSLLGLALVTAGIIDALVRGSLTLDGPTPLTVAPAIVLPFFGLVAIRAAAVYPTSLAANWLFQLTASPERPDYRRGVWTAVIATAVVPTLLVSSVPMVFVWGVGQALALLALSTVVALVTYEWLFLGLRKIPFTCSYLPGAANLRLTWPLHLAIGLFYSRTLPLCVAWVVPRPFWWAVSLIALSITWRALSRYAETHPSARAPLAFEEQEKPRFTELKLLS